MKTAAEIKEFILFQIKFNEMAQKKYDNPTYKDIFQAHIDQCATILHFIEKE